ncbi:hypothetical protein PR048_007672 [Dryococelus australis]|uniref:Uncharacterized protein n=1 Tax=Dryococelus australis TaxID=614101 RepID=A0ABQ9HV45_9NEOP|nr:hypothetical protein PR048_007672 [Dryococelus australis]
MVRSQRSSAASTFVIVSNDLALARPTLLTNSQCDSRAEHLPRRRRRGASSWPSGYRSATLPLNYEGRAPFIYNSHWETPFTNHHGILPVSYPPGLTAENRKEEAQNNQYCRSGPPARVPNSTLPNPILSSAVLETKAAPLEICAKQDLHVAVRILRAPGVEISPRMCTQCGESVSLRRSVHERTEEFKEGRTSFCRQGAGLPSMLKTDDDTAHRPRRAPVRSHSSTHDTPELAHSIQNLIRSTWRGNVGIMRQHAINSAHSCPGWVVGRFLGVGEGRNGRAKKIRLDGRAKNSDAHYSPPTWGEWEFDSRRSLSLIFACGNRAGLCRCSAGFFFSGISRFPRPFIPSAAACSPRFTLFGSQDLDVKGHRNTFTHFLAGKIPYSTYLGYVPLDTGNTDQ